MMDLCSEELIRLLDEAFAVRRTVTAYEVRCLASLHDARPRRRSWTPLPQGRRLRPTGSHARPRRRRRGGIRPQRARRRSRGAPDAVRGDEVLAAALGPILLALGLALRAWSATARRASRSRGDGACPSSRIHACRPIPGMPCIPIPVPRMAMLFFMPIIMPIMNATNMPKNAIGAGTIGICICVPSPCIPDSTAAHHVAHATPFLARPRLRTRRPRRPRALPWSAGDDRRRAWVQTSFVAREGRGGC